MNVTKNTFFPAAPLRIDFFKHHQNLPNKQSRHLHDFTVLNRHFLASAVYSEGGNYCIDSFIYMWNAKEKKFMEHQRLRTRGARKFLFFEESGNFFLAVVNMQHSCGIEGQFQRELTCLKSLLRNTSLK